MIYEFILAFAMYFAIVALAYYFTEVRRLPEWLQYPPFDCWKCLTFWSMTMAGLTLGLALHLYWTMGILIVLAILTAISMHINQKNKTIKI